MSTKAGEDIFHFEEKKWEGVKKRLNEIYSKSGVRRDLPSRLKKEGLLGSWKRGGRVANF